MMYEEGLNQYERYTPDGDKIDGHIVKIEEQKREIKKLNDKILLIEVGRSQEAFLRNIHPAVQNTWEQYQIALKLVR